MKTKRPSLGLFGQVRCHLTCCRRQLACGHLDRIPFHLRGILRAFASRPFAA